MRTLQLGLAVVLVMSAVSGPAIAGGTAFVDADRKVESAVMRGDATTGRAWVEVTLAKRFLTGKEVRAGGTPIAVAVPELSLDRAASQIVLRSGERVVTCATFDGGAVRPTGRCAIDARIEEAIVDTGFGSVKRERLVVDVLSR